MRISAIFLIIVMVAGCTCFAEKIITYNKETQHYEVWDSEMNMLLYRIANDVNIKSNQSKENYYPYQEGFPIVLPCASHLSSNISDIDGDGKREIAVMTVEGKMRLYSYDGLPLQNWTNPILSYIASYADLDSNGNIEIIATQSGNGNLLGAAVMDKFSKMLNGFPNPPDTAFYASSVGDIDRDGNLEIAFAPYAKFYIDDYHLGLYVLGSWGGLLPGFPVDFPFFIPFTQYPYGAAANYANPTLGDFDDDGMLELSVTTGNLKMYLIRKDGSHFRGWPVFIYKSNFVSNPLAIVDVNNDGKLEICTVDTYLDKILCFNFDSIMVKGFPADTARGAYQAPALADIDNDGSIEMFAAGLSQLYGHKNDGSLLPGWPINLNNDVGQIVDFSMPPAIGDIDGDGEMEIIAAGGTAEWCPDGILIAYNPDATLVPGFPIITPHYHFFSSPAITDLDNDGDVEICIGSEYCPDQNLPAYYYCWDLPYEYNKSLIAWENYAHDSQHTGRYVNPAFEPPKVTGVQPDSGSYKGGRPVVIAGENFMAGAKVFFGGVPATNVQVINSTTLYATTPPHKPCYMYINEPSVSPYQLSVILANQQVADEFSDVNARIFNSSSIAGNSYGIADYLSYGNGCITNIVVAHPSPDQREGVLRAGFTYTGYEPPDNNITLFVSKYSPMGTFENNGANWDWITQYGLWNILEDYYNCITEKFPSGSKAMYYGNKYSCNYNSGERNYGQLMMPFIRINSDNAAIRFKYYRDVEYNVLRNADIFSVRVQWWYENGDPGGETILFTKDSAEASEKSWIQSPDLPLAIPVGSYALIFFIFDSVDEIANDYTGIAIDNVELIGAHYESWAETSGEVILNWIGGLPKYFVYRNTSPDYINQPPELRSYTPFNSMYENTLNDDKTYFYMVR